MVNNMYTESFKFSLAYRKGAHHEQEIIHDLAIKQIRSWILACYRMDEPTRAFIAVSDAIHNFYMIMVINEYEYKKYNRINNLMLERH